MRIHKYPIGKEPGEYAICDAFDELLGVSLDPSGQPCLYAIVNPGLLPKQTVSVFVVWTGQEMSPDIRGRYLSTLQVGGLMYHYFAGP